MDQKALIRSLPLLASMLGRKYGVTVKIGGDDAFTNGRCIQLPSLPVEGDENLVNLVRGFLDHETAHIRFTDFSCLDGTVIPIEKHVWNILEDWRVENCFAKLYPGSKHNFQWLIRHIFVSQDTTLPDTPEGLVLSWILLTVRNWDVSELAIQVQSHADALDVIFPQLRFQLEGLLKIMKTNCPDSKAALAYAKKAVACMSQQCAAVDTKKQDGMPDGIPFSFEEAKQRLQGACNGVFLDIDSFPVTVGEAAQSLLAVAAESSVSSNSVNVASIGTKDVQPIEKNVLQHVERVTAGMQTRFHSLMQTEMLTRARPAKKGRIDWGSLYKMAIGRQDMFYERSKSYGVDTAFHILLDSSGSMGSRINLATAVCFSVAKALAVNGINVGITAFPAIAHNGMPTVKPLIQHGECIHPNIRVCARGTTPMAEALWWVLQQISALSDQRKIVMIVSDGEPDELPGTLDAIRKGKEYGVEFYGLGICSPEIKDILPKQSNVISTIDELPSAMFTMLRETVGHQAR
ncbi:cobaltochelatase CobT-related protein [Halodesulfovibrio aestuarii]|uniref:cobaltochelatase CobT-related protein n=1 Tax=Halodesulfovibrio aestuarii TaxID=126333 RepID=UPI000425B52C